MDQYLPIVLLLLIVAGFAGFSVAGSRMLGPKRPTGAKEGPYESGIAPRYEPTARFPVRFYLVAMIFIIFDIEIIFLYPWAVMYHQLATFGLAEMGTFAVVVFIAFAYLVSNGALDWGPRRRIGGRPPADLSRTTAATVLRVARPNELYEGSGPRPVDGEGGEGDGRDREDAGQPATSVPAQSADPPSGRGPPAGPERRTSHPAHRGRPPLPGWHNRR